MVFRRCAVRVGDGCRAEQIAEKTMMLPMRIHEAAVGVLLSLFSMTNILGCAGADDATGTAPNGTGGDGASLGSGGGTGLDTGGTSGVGGAGTAAAPTWTALFNTYLASGTTMGHCGNCHSTASDAASFYADLQRAGQISGTNSAITTQNSVLVWFGGDMPRDGVVGDMTPAIIDFEAWVADGAQNN